MKCTVVIVTSNRFNRSFLYYRPLKVRLTTVNLQWYRNVIRQKFHHKYCRSLIIRNFTGISGVKMPTRKLGFQLVGAHAIAAYHKNPSTQICRCTAGPLRKIPRIHNCTKTWHVWMTDGYILFVKLSNCLTSRSQTEVSMYQFIHGHSTRRLQPFWIAKCSHLSHWGVGHSAEYLRRSQDVQLKMSGTCAFFPSNSNVDWTQDIPFPDSARQTNTESYKVYMCICNTLAPPNLQPSKKYPWNSGSFCVCVWCVLIHISTPSFQNSSCSGLIFNDFDDFNDDFNDDLLIQTFFSQISFSQNVPWPRWCNLPSQ